MKSSFCIDLQRFMLIPTKFPLTLTITSLQDSKRSVKGHNEKTRCTSLSGYATSFFVILLFVLQYVLFVLFKHFFCIIFILNWQFADWQLSVDDSIERDNRLGA